jgi:hypothetical protein
MKNIIITATVLVLFGCKPIEEPDTFPTEFKTIIHEDHEYLRSAATLELDGRMYEAITSIEHKGNCRTCEIKLRELIREEIKKALMSDTLK